MLHTPPGQDPLILDTLLPAPVSRVYRAWTDPDDLVRWFGARPDHASKAEIDLRIGGTWRIKFQPGASEPGWLEGQYTEIVTEERLAFTWTHVQSLPDGGTQATPESKVEIDFADEKGATRLKLRHEGVSSESARANIGNGWVATLGNLETLLKAA